MVHLNVAKSVYKESQQNQHHRQHNINRHNTGNITNHVAALSSSAATTTTIPSTATSTVTIAKTRAETNRISVKSTSEESRQQKGRGKEKQKREANNVGRNVSDGGMVVGIQHNQQQKQQQHQQQQQQQQFQYQHHPHAHHHLHQQQQQLHHLQQASPDGSTASLPSSPPLLQQTGTPPQGTTIVPACAVHHPQQHQQQQMEMYAAMQQAAAAHLVVTGALSQQQQQQQQQQHHNVHSHAHLQGSQPPPTPSQTNQQQHQQQQQQQSQPHENGHISGGSSSSSGGGGGSGGVGNSANAVVTNGVVTAAGPPTPVYIQYPGEFYPTEYYIPTHHPDGMCPQHHHQQQMITMPSDYGPTTVQMVSQNLPPPMPVPVQVQQGQVMQQYVSENGTLTHVVLSPQQYQQLHTGQGHIHAPFLAANGTSHFYSPLPTGFPPGPGGGPPHFHPITSGHLQPQPAQQMSHSPHSPSPPNNYHKDERTQRQHTKLLRKLDQKREMNSAKSTPAHSPSPRKNELNGHHSNHNSNSNNHSGAGSTANNHNSIGHNHNHHNNHNHSTRRNASRNNNGGNGGSAGGAGIVGGGNMANSGIVAGPSSLGTSEDGEEPSNIAEEEDDCQTIIDQLSAIQKPEVIDITSRSAKIIWEGPAIVDNLINMRNLRYNVLLSDRAKECKYKSLYKGESYDCIVQDLQPGQEYVVRLQVHYEKLQGSVSEPTEFTTPSCEPDQPLPPKIIVRTKNSLHLRWTAPYHNGAHIQHYILEYDEGKGSHFVEAAKTKSKQYILTKLTPSTVYNFRLAAVNECGPSMYSIVSTYSTSGNPPSVPKTPILQSATSTMLRLAWERRSQDGEFVLQMLDRESGHGYLNMYNGVDTIYECCSLRRATSYQFRLRADNEAGSSPWSNEVTYKTHPERPGRPSKPQVKGKIHGTYFKVKWDPPNDRGGAEIIRYFLEICSGPKFERIYSGTETETICDRLQPGTSYQIRVACEGPGGQSGYSEVCTVTTEAIVPGAPEPPYCDNPPGPYAAVLRFDKPDYNGGAPILEFELQLSPIPRAAIKGSEDDANKSTNSQPPPAEIIYRGRDSYCVAKDLNPGSMYEARVRAINRIGAGHWSMKYKFSAAAASPFAPDAPAVVIKSPTHLIVTWKEPNNNGAPISEYRLESSYLLSDIDEVRTTSSTATTTTTASTSSTTADCNDYVPTEFTTCYRGMNISADIRNLLPFTLYFFRVNASNSAGSSKFSPIVSTQTPAAVPPAPHFKGYEFTSNEVLLRWCEPDNNGSEITAYNIEYGDRSITTEDNSNEYKISGLTPETNYKFRVQAVNGIGAGPFSSYVKLTTLPSPPKPPTLECTGVGHNFIKLKWAGGKNLDFTKYYIEMYVNRAKDFQIVYSGTNCMCKVNKLQEQTSYTFRICAGNDIAGVGECSQPYVFKTSANLPSSIKAPRVAFEGGVCIINHSSGGNGNSGNAIPSGLISETQNFIAGLGGLTLGIPVTLEWQHSKNSFNDPVEYILQYVVGKETDYKQIYRGPETKFTIENLEPGALYLFRVCPIRVTSTGDLSGQFTIPLRYHVPPLTSIDCIDGFQNNDGNTNNSTSNNHRSGGHHHHSHSHHNHHSRHNQSSGGLNGANGHHLHHRSVSASPGAAVAAATASSSNFNNNGSLLGTNTNQNGSGSGGNSSLITSLQSGNAIGLIPLSAASDLASFAAAGCDDQLLLKVAAAAAAANSNNSHSHSTNNVVAANIAAVAAAAAASVANSSNVSAGNSNSIVAGSILSSNFNVAAAANIGAIRRFTSKLTALYTNRKRFTDQEKAVIFMVSFLFLAILFAALVKMFTS